MQVLLAQRDNLPHPQPTRIKQLQDRVVPQRQRSRLWPASRISGDRAAAPLRSSISDTSLSARDFGSTFQLAGVSIVTVGSCPIRLSSSSQR